MQTKMFIMIATWKKIGRRAYGPFKSEADARAIAFVAEDGLDEEIAEREILPFDITQIVTDVIKDIETRLDKAFDTMLPD